MNQIALKFLLAGGAFFMVALPESKARQMIKDWLSGQLKLKDAKRLGDADGAEGGWAVDVNAIVAMHTVPVQQQPGQAPQAPWQPAGVPTLTSGMRR